MPNFYFFTEVDLLQNQDSVQAFGPVSGFEDHKFLVSDNHTATADPKAIAICGGIAFIQPITGSNNVNLILLPTEQPPFSFPKIKFFIYRNIIKSSLINGNDIAVASTNDLTQSIWDSHIAYNVSSGTTGNPPKESLGIDIIGSQPISDVFFQQNTSYQFPIVRGGWHIGTFDKNGFGFDIILDSVGYEPLLDLVRMEENVIEVPPLSGSPTAQEEFEHWNAKEIILNYIDSSAFFGNFYHHKLYCKKTTGEEALKGDDVYDKLLKGSHLSSSTEGVFFNRNKIYLDIRNEYNFSLNYFRNYGTDINVAYEPSSSLINRNYYDNQWPLCVLDNNFPSTLSGNKLLLRLALPDGNGENPLPSVFLSSGTWESSFPKEPKNREKLIDLTVSNSFTDEIRLSFPKHTSINPTIPISSYCKLKYFKRFDINTSPLPSSGTVIRSQHYLDNIFRPFEMRIAYLGTDTIKTKFYDDEVFVDARKEEGFDFIGKIGIADDGANLTLTVIPTILRGEDLNEISLSAINSETSNSFQDYLSYLTDKLPNKKVRKSNFDFTGPDVTYLEVINEDEDEPDTIEEPQLAGITTIGFSKADFQAIDISPFLPGLPIFLISTNWQNGTDNLGQAYSSFDIGLAGYTANGGNIEVGEITSSIKIYFYERN